MKTYLWYLCRARISVYCRPHTTKIFWDRRSDDTKTWRRLIRLNLTALLIDSFDSIWALDQKLPHAKIGQQEEPRASNGPPCCLQLSLAVDFIVLSTGKATDKLPMLQSQSVDWVELAGGQDDLDE